MKHRNRHADGRHRQTFSPEGLGAGGSSRPEGRRHGRGGGRRGGRNRLFDYGEMRLLVLDLISKKPTYGYELIKTIEETFGGSYTPSPGVIYPTLTWLDEAGYVKFSEEDGRKSYHITPEGEAFLGANKGDWKKFSHGPLLPSQMGAEEDEISRCPLCAVWKTSRQP